jgi:hypothetical protein
MLDVSVILTDRESALTARARRAKEERRAVS